MSLSHLDRVFSKPSEVKSEVIENAIANAIVDAKQFQAVAVFLSRATHKERSWRIFLSLLISASALETAELAKLLKLSQNQTRSYKRVGSIAKLLLANGTQWADLVAVSSVLSKESFAMFL
jgi:ERCC4-type nuclease